MATRGPTTYPSGRATSDGSFVIETGLGFAENIGHAIVVHSAATGDKIGCGVLLPLTPTAAAAIGSYPGSAVPGPTGTVTVGQPATGGGLEVGFSLAGVKPTLTATISPYPGSSSQSRRSETGRPRPATPAPGPAGRLSS